VRQDDQGMLQRMSGVAADGAGADAGSRGPHDWACSTGPGGDVLFQERDSSGLVAPVLNRAGAAGAMRMGTAGAGLGEQNTETGTVVEEFQQGMVWL
jgi:hypothetical protein